MFARELTLDRFGTTKVMTTSGVWVVVTATLGATSASNSVARATWVGPTGLQYDSSDRAGYMPGLPPHSLDPGLPKMARFVFETLPDQVSRVTLVLSNQLFPRLIRRRTSRSTISRNSMTDSLSFSTAST